MPTMTKYLEYLFDSNMALYRITLCIIRSSAICIAYDFSTFNLPESKYLQLRTLDKELYDAILIVDGCVS